MAAFLRNRAGLLLSTSYVFVYPSSLFLARLRPRPKNEFVALKLVEVTDGFQIEDSNLIQNYLFFFFLHIISLRQVFLRVQLSCTYVNKPTKVRWRTGSLLLMRPSSKTRPSLQVSQRHSCFSCVLPWNSVRPSPVKPRPTWKRSLFHFPAYRLRDVYVTVALSVLFQSSLPSTQIVLPMITSVWPHVLYHETPWNHPDDKQTVSKKPVCL